MRHGDRGCRLACIFRASEHAMVTGGLMRLRKAKQGLYTEREGGKRRTEGQIEKNCVNFEDYTRLWTSTRQHTRAVGRPKGSSLSSTANTHQFFDKRDFFSKSRSRHLQRVSGLRTVSRRGESCLVLQLHTNGACLWTVEGVSAPATAAAAELMLCPGSRLPFTLVWMHTSWTLFSPLLSFIGFLLWKTR